MAVLEAVLELKKKGYDDSTIVDLLKEKGISPREILDAVSQANVKSAVDSEKGGIMQMNEAQAQMQPSIMEQAPAQIQVPQAQPEQAQEQYIYPTPQAYSQVEQYPQYPQQQAYQSSGYETETISELAEQIVIEKLSDTNKKLSSLAEFRRIAEAKIESAEQRLRKIESLIENLQLSILNKVGSYGKNLDDIKTEMQAMQDTFSKTLNPLVDRARSQSRGFRAEQAEEADSKQEDAERPARKSKIKDDFGAYLR